MTSGRKRDTPLVVQDEGSESDLDVKTRRKEVRRSLAQDAVNLPNLLTFARILMIPLCLWLLDQDTPRAGFWSAMVFTLAAITDLLDGYLARKLNVVSVLGKFMDPLADKLLVMAVLVYMVPMAASLSGPWCCCSRARSR